MVLHTYRLELDMITLDKLTAYGTHALTVGEYSPTPADPFAAGDVPLSMDEVKALNLTGPCAVMAYVVARAATRARLGITGGHREGTAWRSHMCTVSRSSHCRYAA